ncbi:hypothetical protein GOP47_0017762 [Adiantum capillus-veneris]|uniref:RNA helicase n=1 Tax=Adiantum capillus-veneris TaxID=13818 RepID=A0A9D4UG07_ADICA|nr:hypothetical protein GOP47_0017762 [Adiantum capillus-veneris]
MDSIAEEQDRPAETEDEPSEEAPRAAGTEEGISKEDGGASVTGEISSLSISSADDVVDKPEMTLKSEKLNEEVEAAEVSQIKTVLAADTPYSWAQTFEELNISENLLRGLYSEMKFERPSKIQGLTLPMILSPPYHHLIAQAHNGSGKTTCFVLGMLSRVDPEVQAPQAICVCPTRELAIQNEEVLLKMGKFANITSACAISTDFNKQSSTRRGQVVDQVIIGTPGTIKRWISTKILNTKQIKILVFDEADHMLAQDGFQDDSLRIIQNITKSNGGCQVLFFSATFNENVKNFTVRIAPKANQVFVKKEELSLDVIKQYRVRCPSDAEKVNILKDRIFPAAEKLGQSIIFVRTRASASNLHRRLDADGYKCTSIQGGLSNEDRDRVIREFRSGQTKILISTDVLARGFDQAQVTLVVNYDLPLKNAPPYGPDYELYLHRIGRSGRFGRKGAAFNLLVSAADEENLNQISQYFSRDIPEVPWDDDEAFEKVLKEAGLA